MKMTNWFYPANSNWTTTTTFLSYSTNNHQSENLNITFVSNHTTPDYVVELTAQNVLLALFLISLGLSTVFGNTFVLLAIFIDFHLRSPTHYLMGSLALADLLLGK